MNIWSDNINHFYQNLIIEVKVDWKNSRRSWGVLGLTLWVCLKASKVYPVITTEYEPELGWVLGHIEGTVSACCSWYARVVVLLFEYLLLCPSVHQFLFPWSEVLEQMDISFSKHSLLCTWHWQSIFKTKINIYEQSYSKPYLCQPWLQLC